MRPRLLLFVALTWFLAVPAVSAHDLTASGPAPDLVSILTAWTFEPTVVVGLLAMVVAYVWLVRRVDRGHPAHPWPRRRTAFFGASVATFGLALLSPIDTLSTDLASVHMVQHMLLMMVGPPLMAASAPATLALRAATPAVRGRWLLPILHSRILAAITFPPVGWLTFTLVLWGTHYSAIYDLALLNPTVHVGEHLLYIVAACLFWWPVSSPDPLRWRLSYPAKLGYVFLQLPQMSFLSVTILGAPRLLYEAYLNRSVIYGVDPLADQATSAAIMWVGGDLMFIGSLLVIVAAWMRHEEGETRREDARLDRQGGRIRGLTGGEGPAGSPGPP